MKPSSSFRISLTAATTVVAIAALLGGLMALKSAEPPASKVATTLNGGLAPAKTLPTTTGAVPNFGTLPPSHDNDAGGAREPDQTPDADIDAYQRVH